MLIKKTSGRVPFFVPLHSPKTKISLIIPAIHIPEKTQQM